MSLPLLASILALLVGPLVYSGTRARRGAAAVDAFALVGVAGLVLVHILPQSFELAGWSVIPVALAGLFGPGLLCGTRFFHGRESRVVAMPLALLAIGLHAVLDGFALTPGLASEGSLPLAVAVVLHRLPVGLGIWWLVRPLYGLRAALVLVVVIGAFSVVGYLFGGTLLGGVPHGGIAVFQALLAGSLLHVILRHPPTAAGEEPPSRWRVASAVGALAAALLVLAMGRLGLHADEAGASAGATFARLALESAPALLAAYVAVGLAHSLLLDLRRILDRGTPLVQALRGTALGLPVPICSCGVIPVYRGLIVGGVPGTAAMAFLVATPELGIAAIVLSWQLLGAEVTAIRVGCAILLALVVGWTVGRTIPRRADADPSAPQAAARRPALSTRLAEGLRFGFGDMVDSTAPWLLVGLALAAAADPLLRAEAFARLPTALEVPLFALIGMPMYVCASGSTPLVAVLLGKGVGTGAAVAFLLTGPATNVTTFGVLSRLHGRRTALLFAGLVATLAVLLGYAVDLLLPATTAASIPALHEDGAGPLQTTSLALLALLYLASLLRQGTRGFIGQVIAPHSHAEPDGCTHDAADGDACKGGAHGAV